MSEQLDLRMSVKYWQERAGNVSAMRVICCGGRDYCSPQSVWRTLAVLPVGVVIVHGACNRGADEYVDRFARRLGMTVEAHPADWTLGRRAGPERNERMADLGADLCIAFPGGRGTADMIRRAAEHGIPVVTVPAMPEEVAA